MAVKGLASMTPAMQCILFMHVLACLSFDAGQLILHIHEIYFGIKCLCCGTAQSLSEPVLQITR